MQDLYNIDCALTCSIGKINVSGVKMGKWLIVQTTVYSCHFITHVSHWFVGLWVKPFLSKQLQMNYYKRE